MQRSIFMCWTLLAFAHSTQHVGVDSEEPSASSWLQRDWSNQNQLPEQVFKDTYSGCLCRSTAHSFVVCYGLQICRKFPKNITIFGEVTDLRLRNTGIGKVNNEDMLTHSSLQVLLIDANNHLKKIVPGAFEGMVNLKNLSISYNSELKSLVPDTFRGLINLEVLTLVKNGFEHILDVSVALQAKYLPNLLRLSLNENYFPKINETSFAPLTGTNIVELELILCQIENLAPSSLNFFRKLKTLRLGDNLIDDKELGLLLVELKNEQIFVDILNLYNLGLRRDANLAELLEIIADLNVSHLILSRNHIEYVSADLFPPMPNLEILDLREVSAVKVEHDTFDKDFFPNLKVLLLAGNKLAGILPGVLLPQLSFLDISDNSGGANFPSYFDVSATSEDELSLKSFDLSYNRISTISHNTFRHFKQLEVLGLKNATIFYIHQEAFATLNKLRVLNLENNPFQPFNQFNATIFRGLTDLETLYLGRCKIVSFNNTLIFKGLTSLKYLNLNDNELLTIDYRLTLPLVSLEGIDVSENLIQPWVTERFQNHPNLKFAIFSTNRINTVSLAMMKDFANLTLLDISHNAFFCDCWAFNQTIAWLRERNWYANQTPISSPNHVCSAPENWRDQPIAAFIDSTESCTTIPNLSDITTPVYVFLGALVVVSLVLGAFTYIYRWHIRYWIFLARMAFLRRHGWMLKNNKVHPGDYKYDVFVSYSHEDRNFIVRLVAMLENQAPFLKLCVYERDFEIGTVISDTVLEKVTMSRRTLLVVSNAFAKSQWCMWEMQLAESHRLFFRNGLKEGCRDDPLVIIKLGPIAQCNMTPTLKYLLKSRIYLEWNHEPKKQVGFWEKLRTTLTPEDKKSLVPKKAILEL